MIYAISDIHGRYDKYQAMLGAINFSGNDTLLQFLQPNGEEMETVCEYLPKLSAYREITVQGRQFVLVHAGPESPNEKNAFHITDGNAGETVQWPDRSNLYGRDNLDCYGEDKNYRLEV